MKKEDLITLVFILLLAAIFGSVSILYPYGRDQGIYAYISNIILDGGLPYKDAWDFKPPGIYYIFGLSSLLFGKSMISIRIFEIIWQAGTALIISAVAAKVFRRKYLGLIVSSAYLFLYYTNGFWHTAQSESFLSLPLAASVFFFLFALEKKKSYLLFSAGFSLGLAVLFKYPFGLILAVMVPLIFWYKDPLPKSSSKTKAQELRRRLLGAGALVIGFLLPILIILVYFYTNAALKDFITTEFTLASNYVRLSFQDKSFFYFFTQGGFRFFACIALFLMTLLFLWFEKKLSGKTWFVIGWAGTCLLSVVLQGKFFRYHYFPLIAPLALLCLIVLYSYGEKSKRLLKKIRPALFGLCFLILCFLIGRFYLGKMFSLMSVVQRSTTLGGHYYTCEEYDRGDFSLRADIEVADFLAKNTSSEEGIYIWGFEPIIYGLASRRCISRFIYNVPLYWKWVIPEYKEELLDTLREKKPKYFLVVENDAIPWVTGLPYGSERAFEDFVELKQIIAEEYELGIQIEDFRIYFLKRLGN